MGRQDSAINQAVRRAQVRWFLMVLTAVLVLLMLFGSLIQVAAAWLATWWGLPAGGSEAVLSLDSLVHLLFFALLAVSGFRPWWSQYRLQFVLFLVALAGLTECLQALVPGRSASWSDLGMDLAGSGIGLGLCLLWRGWKGRAGLLRGLPLAQRS